MYKTGFDLARRLWTVERDIRRAAASLRRLARRTDLKEFILANPPLYAALSRAARRYVAGETRADALRLARTLADRGHRATIDFMGEDTGDLRAARAATDEFAQLGQALTSLRGRLLDDASISLDLSHVGLAIGEQVAFDHANSIAETIAGSGREIMISMESSARTDAILRIHRALAERHSGVGITLQAALRRTDADLTDALGRPGRIRLVKGAYGESASVGLERGAELDDRYVRLLTRVLDAGHPCSIGTHDPNLIDAIRRFGRLDNAEFEMLYGAAPARLDALRADGVTTRAYTVYGREWYLYLCHRLAEHPPSLLGALADAIDGARVGIQGGRGSFNELAAQTHVPTSGIGAFEIVYLDTTRAVLQALDAGDIDYGQFAIYNSSAGLYEESLAAVAEHTFRIVDRYAIPIRHMLMAHPGVDLAQLTRILTHPAVIGQCATTLRDRFPDLTVEASEGAFTDPAAVAAAISTGELPGTGVVSCRAIADVYGLRVLAEDLQDDASNTSGFLLVTK